MTELSLNDLLRINDAAELFEAGWRKGQRPRIEAFLSGISPPLRNELLETLLEIEIELRRGSPDPARPEEFARRFPAHLAIVAAAFRDADHS